MKTNLTAALRWKTISLKTLWLLRPDRLEYLAISFGICFCVASFVFPLHVLSGIWSPEFGSYMWSTSLTLGTILFSGALAIRKCTRLYIRLLDHCIQDVQNLGWAAWNAKQDALAEEYAESIKADIIEGCKKSATGALIAPAVRKMHGSVLTSEVLVDEQSITITLSCLLRDHPLGLDVGEKLTKASTEFRQNRTCEVQLLIIAFENNEVTKN